MLLGQYETYSRRCNPSPSLTRSLPLVSPFQGSLHRGLPTAGGFCIRIRSALQGTSMKYAG
ncbi:MAG: hypothetical protein DVB29_00960 [Verrucomicrobia bacterium]|nr:MAG: hypothetical protein DVB29_00960 [Verrucomicrobiota bacterium]MDH4470307.1 hypothetical protein [Verrucomicrobiae bacterium]